MFSQIRFIDLPARHRQLLPLTATRPIADLRVGIMRIRDKWQRRLPTANFDNSPHRGTCLYINGAALPTDGLVAAIDHLPPEHSLWSGDELLVYRASVVYEQVKELIAAAAQNRIQIVHTAIIGHLTDIFVMNRQEIEADLQIIRGLRQSYPLTDRHTAVYGAENIFIEEGAVIKAAVLNAENGPIYIGKNAVVGEGSLIRGAFALCEGAQLNMGTIIRGDTTVGDYCKVGGEISNSVFLGYSNKAHEGFMGNSVVGEYCNLGAGTTVSNMKNTAGPVKLWNYALDDFEILDRQFCGVFLGDFCMTGIHTTFNTGTVAGPGLNLFGVGIPPKFIPPFAWGTPRMLTAYQPEKLKQTINRMRAFKQQPPMNEQEEKALQALFPAMSDYLISAAYAPENIR
ncbi:putative sugar nucleotidyl transferase [Rhodoflexus sp.]